MNFDPHLDIPRLKTIIQDWGKSVINDLSASGAYLFGSLVYKDGERFVSESDIDLVVAFPQSCKNAIERFQWSQLLKGKKFELEQKLLTVLERTDVVPFASIVLVTQEEIGLDIHKDRTPEFFSQNVFEDLTNGNKKTGLPKTIQGSANSRFLSTVISFVQEVRNSYLSIAANNRSEMTAYSGEDPMPKPAMRAAAMARAHNSNLSSDGEEYDTKEGLDYFGHKLYELKQSDDQFSALQNLFSIRRNARGKSESLAIDDQLLIAEIIFDLVAGKQSSSAIPGGERKGKIREEVLTESLSLSESVSLSGTAKTGAEFKFLDSSVLFSKRFVRTFPGVRALRWFYDSVEATNRLLRLLEEPLDKDGYFPIWWWRGGNLQIERCRKISDTEILLNVEELQIAKIAASPGDTYKQSFVYVETVAMPPIGLYDHDQKYIDQQLEDWGYADEEYGLFRGHPISRGEYDDGAAEIGGELIDTASEAELRIRYITPYNFIIAAQASPINNHNFDRRLKELLNSALKFDSGAAVNELVEAVRLLPARPL